MSSASSHSEIRKVIRLCVVLGLAASVGSVVLEWRVHAQLPHATGQNVVPVFEGWQRNTDGTFNLVFGSFNRNTDEEVDIPLGPVNNFSPEPSDRGQPTHFYPRRQRFTFSVRVPPDFGKRELVWALTSRGKTEKAYGHLNPLFEIDRGIMMAEGRRGRLPQSVIEQNQPPIVHITPVPIVEHPRSQTLTASISDDGLPARKNDGLKIAWTLYRGPGVVTFASNGFVPVDNGTASTVATFAAPGAYVLRATATDGLLNTHAHVNVTVK